MTKLGDALREARESLGMTQAEFAKRVGVAQQRIGDIESGKTTGPRKWEAIADAAGIERAEFARLIEESAEEAGAMRLPRSVRGNIPESARRAVREFVPPNAGTRNEVPRISRRRIPVYGQAVGGADGEYIFNGQLIDDTICPPGLENVPDAYAVNIDGDSMFPRFKSGETAIVHPGRPPRRGDDVVVQIANKNHGEPPHGYVKEFLGWSGSKLKLGQFNPHREITFSRDDVISVHKIVFRV